MCNKIFPSVLLFLFLGFAGFFATGNAQADDIICGNVNSQNSNLNILDVTGLIKCLYLYDFQPCNPAVADVDGNGIINILDIIYLINFLYKGGPQPICNSTPTGQLISNSGCLTEKSLDEQPPSNQDCFEYAYDGIGTLALIHYNAGFNCCPDGLSAEINFTDNTINISEVEEGGFCDCNCLFNLNYEINNLPPGEYTVVFTEPYRHEAEPILEGTIILESTVSDIVCVPRYFYPWGF
ncbi:MAG: dockerin type I domain-containing protein [Candidatus Zixiibacteriota bacterium]